MADNDVFTQEDISKEWEKSTKFLTGGKVIKIFRGVNEKGNIIDRCAFISSSGYSIPYVYYFSGFKNQQETQKYVDVLLSIASNESEFKKMMNQEILCNTYQNEPDLFKARYINAAHGLSKTETSSKKG